MKSMYKKLRHSYWLTAAFLKKNVRFLLISFIIGFFIILVSINIFPFINTYFFKEKVIIGIVGRYSVRDIPQEIRQDISTPLITVDQDGNIKPVLAHSYEILDDQTTYRFHLKTDLFWSDNKKFNANSIDLKFQDVETKVVDDYTIDFVLKQKLNIFPIYLTQPMIKYPLAGVGAQYKVQNFNQVKNELRYIQLTPNKPDLPLKEYRFYHTEDDLIAAYKKGEITQFTTSSVKIADLFSDWNNTDILRSEDYSKIMTLFMNTESGILQERDVRKGIAYATPEFPRYGVPAKTSIPPVSWAYSGDVKEYPLNVEKAKSFVDDYIDESSASTSGTLTLNTFFDYIDIAEELKTRYEEIGLKIDIKVVSFLPQEFDLFLTVWSPPTDPDQYFFWHSSQKGTNITKLNNVKVDKYLEEGRRLLNPVQRKINYADFQKTIAEEVPAYFMFHPYEYTIRRK